MGVVVAEHALVIELVNRDTPGLAQEELPDDAILDRDDGCIARRQNISRLMHPSGAALLESVSNVVSVQAPNRQSQLAPGKQFVVVACPKIVGGDQACQEDRETADRE